MTSGYDISVLNSLITITIDSADGFEQASEDAGCGRYAHTFRNFAIERRRCVARLQDAVKALGGIPNERGSLVLSVDHSWLDLRDSLSGGDAAIVDEFERGEDHIKSKYSEALDDRALSPTAFGAVREAGECARLGPDRTSQLKHSLQAAND